MKMSGTRTLSRGRRESRPRNSRGGDVFVMCIDRARLIEQLLDLADSRGLPRDRRN
jgi:hypothetical protein